MATTFPQLAQQNSGQLPLRPMVPSGQDQLANVPVSLMDQIKANQVQAQTPAGPPSSTQMPYTAQQATPMPPALRPVVNNPQQDIVNKPVVGPLTGGFWHKLGQVASRIGQAGAATFIPGAAAAEEMIPGTMLYNQAQHEQAAESIKRSQEQEQLNSEMQLRQAQTANIPQESKLKQEELDEQLADHGMKIGDDGKLSAQDPEEWSPGFKADQEMKEAQIYGLKNPWSKLPDKEPLENVDNINAAFQQRYDVYHPNTPLPEEFKLGKGATKGDFDRMDKMLNAIEMAEGKKDESAAKRADAQAARASARAITMMGLSMRQNKQDTTQRGQIYKTYQPVMDSAERMNVMTQNYEDAVGKHDQQAMLSLLYNHMGMTMGLQKGARMTQDLIREAQRSQPWLQGIKAKFDKDGYLSGVTLSNVQMREMINNAQGRYQEDVRKARGEASYLGATDDGPERIQNKATIHYYLNQAGGDPNKAKQLSSNDGWAVK